MLLHHAIQITPSEITLLNSNNEGDPILFGALTRKLENGNSSSKPLLKRILRTAFCANREAGIFEYRLRRKKTPFGIASSSRLMISLNKPRSLWPEPSLEAKMVQWVRELSREEDQVTVAAVIGKWVGVSAITHFQSALEWLYDALTQRGWVRRELEERLNLFRLTRYVIPESTIHMARAFSTSPQELITHSNGGDAPTYVKDIAREIERAVQKLDPTA